MILATKKILINTKKIDSYINFRYFLWSQIDKVTIIEKNQKLQGSSTGIFLKPYFE